MDGCCVGDVFGGCGREREREREVFVWMSIAHLCTSSHVAFYD